jgi:hypothetical protein
MTVGQEPRLTIGVIDHTQPRGLQHATDPFQLEQQFVVLAADERGDLVLGRQPHPDLHVHARNPKERVSHSVPARTLANNASTQ